MAKQELFNRVLDRTKEAVKSNEELRKMLVEVGEKLTRLGDDSKESGVFKKQIQLLIRMVTAHFNGSYQAFSAGTVLMLMLALVYFLLPSDIIPDIFPILGFTDDLAVTVFIMRRFSDDIHQYRAWENELESE